FAGVRRWWFGCDYAAFRVQRQHVSAGKLDQRATRPRRLFTRGRRHCDDARRRSHLRVWSSLFEPRIFGLLGQAPKMIPVKVNLHTSRDRTETYSYELANDSFLTPLLLNITLFNTITSSERALGDSTISVKGEIKVKGQEPVQIDRRFSAANSAIIAAGAIAAPVSSLLTSGFDDVQLDGITLDIASTETKYAGTLERI